MAFELGLLSETGASTGGDKATVDYLPFGVKTLKVVASGEHKGKLRLRPLRLSPTEGEKFGYALATGQLIGSSHVDLAVGAPFDFVADPGPQPLSGRATIIAGSAIYIARREAQVARLRPASGAAAAAPKGRP